MHCNIEDTLHMFCRMHYDQRLAVHVTVFFKMYKVWSQIVVTAECHLAHYQESNCQDILAGIQFTGWATVQPPSAVVHVMALFSCLCIVSKFCSNQIEAHTWHDLCSWSPIPSKLCSTLLLLKRCVTGLTVSLLSDYLNCSHISSHDKLLWKLATYPQCRPATSLQKSQGSPLFSASKYKERTLSTS